MKRKRTVNNSRNLKDNSMILHKIKWTRDRYGNLSGKSKPFETGIDILRKAYIKEVVPNRQDYFMRPNGSGNDYYLLNNGFSQKVDFKQIKHLVKSGCVFVRKDFKL